MKNIIPIPDIYKYEGSIPAGYELVVFEKNTNPSLKGFVLYGFDEIGDYRSYGIRNPQYCFLKIS